MNGHDDGVDYLVKQAIEREKLDAQDIQDFNNAGYDYIYQAGRTAKAYELAIEAQEAVIALGK